MSALLWRKGTWVAFLIVSLCFLGCSGPKTVTVTGTVVRDGKPIAVGPAGTIDVTLVPDVGPEEQYTTYPGYCDATGKFEILDVPPGKYRVAIAVLDPTPQNDKLGGAYSVENTKIKRDIDGKAPLTIDLARPDET